MPLDLQKDQHHAPVLPHFSHGAEADLEDLGQPQLYLVHTLAHTTGVMSIKGLCHRESWLAASFCFT